MAELTPEELATWRAEAAARPGGQRCDGIHDATSDRRVVILTDALAEWYAACDEVGVPRNPDALIRHHRNNAAAVAHMRRPPRRARPHGGAYG